MFIRKVSSSSALHVNTALSYLWCVGLKFSRLIFCAHKLKDWKSRPPESCSRLQLLAVDPIDDITFFLVNIRGTALRISSYISYGPHFRAQCRIMCIEPPGALSIGPSTRYTPLIKFSSIVALISMALFRYTQKPKTLQDSPSHRILRHMHEVLNIDKKNN